MKVFSDTNQFMVTFTITSILLDLAIKFKIYGWFLCYQK